MGAFQHADRMLIYIFCVSPLTFAVGEDTSIYSHLTFPYLVHPKNLRAPLTDWWRIHFSVHRPVHTECKCL